MTEGAGQLQQWAADAADSFGYSIPPRSWVQQVCDRLGDDLVAEVLAGTAAGLVHTDRGRFTLPELGPDKGPYAWFSRSSATQIPAPNWEYFVQVATWLTVRRSVPPGLQVGFEDGLMDVSVRRADSVLWCIEVKEKAAQLGAMLVALERHSSSVDLEANDRHDDPLRKAKYIVRHRPRFFSLVAAARWVDFGVDYPDGHAFRLLSVTRDEVHAALQSL